MIIFAIKKNHLIDWEIIGHVISGMKDRVSQPAMKGNLSKIRILPQFADGLWKLEESRFIEVVFIMHLSQGYHLITNTYTGERKGVFATHHPDRPSKIGITVAELMDRTENELLIKGLDALDGSPVIDIRPFSPKLKEEELNTPDNQEIRNNPRKEIAPLIWAGDLEGLMIHASRLHGHRCPMLTLGVMISHFALQEMRVRKWALPECCGSIRDLQGMMDGVQMITGFTAGNRRLTINPYQLPELRITNRNGENISVYLNVEVVLKKLQVASISEWDCLKIHDTINFNLADGGRLKQQLLNQSLYLQSINYNRLFSVL